MCPLNICCTSCGRSYPLLGLPYKCADCKGIYDFSSPWIFDQSLVDKSQPGIWQFRSTFGLPANLEPVSLGEGNTPLIWAKVLGRDIGFKCEFQNPTGSFKDRGTAVLVGWLQARGITEAVEDSSGNAGASLAAYAARAGIKIRIFVPADVAGPKHRQIKALGANLVSVLGTRSDVAMAVLQEAEMGASYASHAFLPFNLPGYATAAYEIYKQLGDKFPGAVILPVGQGGLLLGLTRGFESLRIAILKTQPSAIKREDDLIPPRIIGIQALACAPLWTEGRIGVDRIRSVTENPTLAEGVKVRFPVRGADVLRSLIPSNSEFIIRESGSILAAREEEILPGQEALAHLGFFVEPTSALIWSALRQTLDVLPDPIVVILTGSGYKYEKTGVLGKFGNNSASIQPGFHVKSIHDGINNKAIKKI